jgi:hypothetical protein
MTAPAIPEQPVKKSSAGIWLSVTFIVILLIAAAPVIVSFAANAIASVSGCEINALEVHSPCAVMGSEVSQGLTTLIFMGYFAFYSLPLGAFLLAIWAVIACVVVLVRWLRRRRAAA